MSRRWGGDEPPRALILRKIIWLLNVDNYAPEIVEITYPLFQRYARKIGADIVCIKERVFLDWPTPCEKLQIYNLAREAGADWNIYFDIDAAIHPDVVDFTMHVPKDTVMGFWADVSDARFQVDNYFRRDGRHIGGGNWLMMASDWCLDLWHPLDDMSWQEAVQRIFPTVHESTRGVTAEHLLDDYITSRNIARFGLKFTTVRNVYKAHGRDHLPQMWHQYTIPVAEKITRLRELVKAWEV